MSTPSTTNPDRTPVAHDVFTMCTKEKIKTFHVVMNHNTGGVVDRVQCKSCKSVHKYKSEAIARVMPVKSSRTSRASTVSSVAPSRSTEVLSETWLAKLKTWGDRTPRDFDPAVSFIVGEVIQHVVFGKGVIEARRDNKVDVLFQAGVKTLPSAQPAKKF